MTAPCPLLAAACLLLAAAPVAASAPPASASLPAPSLPPSMLDEDTHWVHVVVVADKVRQVDVSLGLNCAVDDDPDSDPAKTRLALECEPDNPAQATCLSTRVAVAQAGNGVHGAASCGEGAAADCTAPFPARRCVDEGAGGDLPFRCLVEAWHPVVAYRVLCTARF